MIHSDSMKMDPKIKCFSELYFNYFITEKGVVRFQKDVLNQIEYFKPLWLKNAFSRMEKKYECEQLKTDNGEWVEFTEDENVNKMYELIYQVRLAFAELYRKFKTVSSNDITGKEMIHSDSMKMDPKIKCFSELYFDYFITKKGVARFQKEILNEIKDFKPFWIKDAFARIAEKYECEQLKMDYDGLVELMDDENVNKMYELIYQVRLAFAELCRKYNLQNQKI